MTTTHTREWGDGRIFLRGRRYWIAYWDKCSGKECREPGGDTEKAASKKLRQRLGEIQGGEFVAGADRLTVNDLLDALETHLALKQAKSTSFASHIAVIRRHFGLDRATKLSTARLEKFQQEELAAGKASRQPLASADGYRPSGKAKAPATVNRELGVLRQAFRLAVKQKRLTPQQVPYFPMLTERNARQGFFEAEEFAAVVARLPHYLADMARFAYLTGWRRGEIVGLRWADVDRQAREIRLPTSKNGRGRVLCFDETLAALLEARWTAREVTRHNAETDTDDTFLSPLVFHRDGLPVGDTRKAWATACRKANLPDGKLFHDLRRTAVRDMVRAGVPQAVAMSISGHETVSMFLRYKITSGDEQRAALERVRLVRDAAPTERRSTVVQLANSSS